MCRDLVAVAGIAVLAVVASSPFGVVNTLQAVAGTVEEGRFGGLDCTYYTCSEVAVVR